MIDKETGWVFSPTSIKVVGIDSENCVLLCLNDRGDWVYRGGWPSPGDQSLDEVGRRELREETGLEAGTLTLAGADMIVDPNARDAVVLVVLAGRLLESPPEISNEHSEVSFFAIDSLPERLNGVYERAIRASYGLLTGDHGKQDA